MQQRQMDQQQGQFEQTNLLARDKFAEDQRQFGMTNQLARDKFGLLQARNPYELALLEAQAKTQRAHAGLYNTQASNVRAQAEARNAPPPPTPTFGQRPDGTIYEINSGNGPVDVGGGPGEDVLQGAGRFGARGLMPRDVPGVVVTPQGSTDRAATAAQAGQDAVASTPEEDRKRFETYKRTQDHWTYLNNGKPAGVGKAYAADGRIVELGSRDTATDRQARVIAQHGLSNLDKATEALVGVVGDPSKGIKDVPPTVGTLGQLAGDSWKVPGIGVEVGGWGEGGRAFRNAKRTVMDLNFALSGKSVSNAEREAFLELYMPKSTESRESQDDKLKGIRKFFSTVMAARNTGATDEQIAEIYRGAIIRGGPEQAGRRMPGGPPQTAPGNPAADRLKSKYGLE